MLNRVSAIRYAGTLGSGRTKPCHMSCVQEDGSEVDVVVKLASGCDMKQLSLATEALCAMLAADLDLPVPEPFAVEIDKELAASVPDKEARKRLESSIGWNFGSRKLPPAFGAYPRAKPLSTELVQAAVEIFAFDLFIANSDRTAANPNLLFNGREIAIYDHELALLPILKPGMILGWKAPWLPGGARAQGAQLHVFWEHIRGKATDLGRLGGAFESISTARLADYRQAMPTEWLADGQEFDLVFDYLAELRAKIESAIKEVQEALR